MKARPGFQNRHRPRTGQPEKINSDGGLTPLSQIIGSELPHLLSPNAPICFEKYGKWQSTDSIAQRFGQACTLQTRQTHRKRQGLSL
jgi:hypothetical protein